ncbi:hypothetical protein [Phenylobacterium sp.]|uniref:hypothetical protein n=1 Tax=Phenylobacterium sp. TaxID=1871053 RepID=UPI0035B055A9
MFDQITLIDERMLAKSWTCQMVYERRPGAFVSDYICVERGEDNPCWVSGDGAATVHSRRQDRKFRSVKKEMALGAQAGSPVLQGR